MPESSDLEQSTSQSPDSVSCRVCAGFAILGIGLYISFITPYLAIQYGEYLGATTLLQLGAIISSAAAPLLFAAPRIPRIKRFVRPSRFEDGWETLLTLYKLNQDDRGFNEVLDFLGDHRGNGSGDSQRDIIASDHGIEDISNSEVGIVDLVEEVRIEKVDLGRDAILFCYDEETGGPAAERNKTANHGFTKPNVDEASDDWRWLGPIIPIEHNASAYISEQIDKWAMYGGIAIAISVILQISVISLRAI
ncbi:hypothetical protein [Natrialba chahannaoensis]|uniref:hypothetical protein n=1 Tax=Natrialba chahannaoensis TaxID=68911 RepID=UPI0012685D61|nr:hypothetical protein [Natrialba chahannaoensis]